VRGLALLGLLLADATLLVGAVLEDVAVCRLGHALVLGPHLWHDDSRLGVHSDCREPHSRQVVRTQPYFASHDVSVSDLEQHVLLAQVAHLQPHLDVPHVLDQLQSLPGVSLHIDVELVAHIARGAVLLLPQQHSLALYLQELVVLNIVDVDLAENDYGLRFVGRSVVEPHVDQLGAIAALEVVVDEFGGDGSQVHGLRLRDAEEIHGGVTHCLPGRGASQSGRVEGLPATDQRQVLFFLGEPIAGACEFDELEASVPLDLGARHDAVESALVPLRGLAGLLLHLVLDGDAYLCWVDVRQEASVHGRQAHHRVVSLAGQHVALHCRAVLVDAGVAVLGTFKGLDGASTSVEAHVVLAGYLFARHFGQRNC